MKQATRLLALLLALVMVFGFAACGKKPSPEGETTTTAPSSEEVKVEGLTKEEYDAMTAEDLLARIKDTSAVTADEYYWLLSTYAYVDIVDDPEESYYYLADSITKEALDKLETDAIPSSKEYIDRLLDSPYPQVRGYGASLFGGLFGASGSDIERAKKLLETEEDHYVLYKLMDSLSNELATDPAVKDFAFRMAKAEDPKLRATAAYGIGNSWSKDVDGVVDMIIELIGDKDDIVRSIACRRAGQLKDDAVIDPLVAILNNDDDYELHGDCVSSLVDLWWDYPFMEAHSEKAYRATIDYLSKTPRTENVPYWTTVGSFKTINDDKFEEWKAGASYYNTDEIYDVMVDIVKDENANWLGRSAAIDMIKAHCSAEQFAALKDIVYGLTDSKADLLKSSYDDKAAQE